MSLTFQRIRNWLQCPVSVAPLVVFRVVFGAMMFFAVSRTICLGWVDKFYISPTFFFKFYGFEWVQPLGAVGMYAVFGLMCLAALGIMLGAFYRISSLLFFLIFTYIELIDVTHYLNHYYLISLLAFLLCWLPAHRAYSVDVWRKPLSRLDKVPRWMIFILQFQLGLVYFYAGIAKLHPDWLLNAQPLRIWLLRQGDFPLIGGLLSLPISAYIFAWFGAVYDLTIPFWMCWKRSRHWAYTTVIIFHVATAMLFNIGVFPILMIGFTLIFFSEFWHQKIIANFGRIFILTLSKLKYRTKKPWNEPSENYTKVRFPTWGLGLVFLYMTWQLLFPLRHWLYPGNVLWTEEGFRFAWKVMVVEKTATAQFRVRDAQNNRESEVNNLDYLTQKQEVMMAYQPDLLVQFANHLAKDFRENKGYIDPIVTVECFVSLNGRPARRFIDPNVDLGKEKNSLVPKHFLLNI